MAITYYIAKGLIGGGANAIDNIAGADPIDLDVVFTEENGVSYRHLLDADSAKTESSPSVIEFDADGGDKRFILQPDTIDIRRGFCIRPKFTWKDADEIYLGGSGAYHTFDGTNHRIDYWVSQLTFQFQNLAASDWSYLYIDESTVDTLVGPAGSALLTASQFVDSTDTPSYSASKGGFYNGSDRCIFGVLTTAGSAILEFFHDGDIVLFADNIESQGAIDIDAAFADIDPLDIPSFATVANIYSVGAGGAANWTWRTNDQSGGTGHHLVASTAGASGQEETTVITDSSQIIEVKKSAGNGETIAVFTQGWEFPVGM